jgi:hypothetical protein
VRIDFHSICKKAGNAYYALMLSHSEPRTLFLSHSHVSAARFYDQLWYLRHKTLNIDGEVAEIYIFYNLSGVSPQRKRN